MTIAETRTTCEQIMKIDNRLVSILFLLLSCHTCGLSQSEMQTHSHGVSALELLSALRVKVDTNNVMSMIAQVYSADVRVSTAVALYLGNRHLTAGSTSVRQRYESTKGVEREAYLYLAALYALDDPAIGELLREYVDSAASAGEQDRPTWSAGLGDVFCMLLDRPDYTRFESFVQLYSSPGSGTFPFFLLSRFATNPALRDSVRSELMGHTTEVDVWNRSTAYSYLATLFPDDAGVLSALRAAALEDSSALVRLNALAGLRGTSIYDSLVIQVCEGIAATVSELSTFERAINELSTVSSPYVLASLKRILAVRTSQSSFYDYGNQEYQHRILAGGSYSFARWAQEASLCQRLDTLRAQLYATVALGWLAGSSLFSGLDSLLVTAHNALQNADSSAAGKALDRFIGILNQVHEDSIGSDGAMASIDGWRYLKGIAEELLGDLAISRVVPRDYHTIQAAVEAARFGDKILVMPGTYDEIVRVSSQERLVISAWAGAVQIRGFDISGSSRIKITGMRINASGTGRPAIRLLQGESANSIIFIENSDIRNSAKGHPGVWIGGGNTLVRIANCVIGSNGEDGISIEGGTGGRHYVINNTIVRNAGCGIAIGRDDTVYAVNNLLCFNGTSHDSTLPRYGILSENDTRPEAIVLVANTIVGNNGSISQSSTRDLGNYASILDTADHYNLTTVGVEGLGVTAAPSTSFLSMFLSEVPLDLRPAVGSSTIDSGVPSFWNPDLYAGDVPTRDRNGTVRPQGVLPDRGAFER
jgi:hypothetical protein